MGMSDLSFHLLILASGRLVLRGLPADFDFLDGLRGISDES